MSILFLAFNISAKGGAENIVAQLANQLTKQGKKVFIHTIFGDAQSYFDLNPGIEITSSNCPSGSSWGAYLKAAFALRKYLSQIKPSTIVVNGPPIALLGYIATAFKGIRRILWDHSAFSYNAPHWKLVACLTSSYVVVLTNKDKQLYEKVYPVRRATIRVVCNFFNPHKRTRQANVVHSRQVISVGRLTHEKGVDRLLDVWLRIVREFPDWTLVVVGEGADRAKLEERAVPNVEFLGQRPDAVELIAQSAIFAMASRTEGFGIVLIEAQSVGVPTIAYDCPNGPSEVIAKNTGVLVENGNVNLYCEALSSLMRSSRLRLELSQNCAKNVRRFDTNKIIAEWIRIIK